MPAEIKKIVSGIPIIPYYIDKLLLYSIKNKV